MSLTTGALDAQLSALAGADRDALFKMLDRNGDNEITAEELNAGLEQLAEQRRQELMQEEAAGPWRARVIEAYDNEGYDSAISLQKGAYVLVTDIRTEEDDGWWAGHLWGKRKVAGFFPSVNVEVMYAVEAMGSDGEGEEEDYEADSAEGQEVEEEGEGGEEWQEAGEGLDEEDEEVNEWEEALEAERQAHAEAKAALEAAEEDMRAKLISERAKTQAALLCLTEERQQLRQLKSQRESGECAHVRMPATRQLAEPFYGRCLWPCRRSHRVSKGLTYSARADPPRPSRFSPREVDLDYRVTPRNGHSHRSPSPVEGPIRRRSRQSGEASRTLFDEVIARASLTSPQGGGRARVTAAAAPEDAEANNSGPQPEPEVEGQEQEEGRRSSAPLSVPRLLPFEGADAPAQAPPGAPAAAAAAASSSSSAASASFSPSTRTPRPRVELEPELPSSAVRSAASLAASSRSAWSMHRASSPTPPARSIRADMHGHSGIKLIRCAATTAATTAAAFSCFPWTAPSGSVVRAYPAQRRPAAVHVLLTASIVRCCCSVRTERSAKPGTSGSGVRRCEAGCPMMRRARHSPATAPQ
jgi:hypothetical protein